MRSIRFALFLAVFLCSLLVGLPAQDSALIAEDPSVISSVLDNGMTVHLIENKEPANRIMLRLAVRAGSVLEDDDQSGIAHLIEHMAFNGTANFKKNELIDYFESIGMAFGPEVNAYTSFDETVYMLEIPADNPAIIEKSLLVLHDWACAITFDPDELDKERGVVIEEWRMGRGANGRVQDKQIPLLFRDSRYALRRPIGDPEIVRTISRERIMDFYRDWYRSDHMSVIAVGDFDVDSMNKAINKALSTVPASKATRAKQEYPVPLQMDPAVLVIRDPEISYTTVQILEQFPAQRLRTLEDYRKRTVESLAVSILNKRLSEKTYEANPLFLASENGVRRILRQTQFSYVAMVPSAERFNESFTLLLTELDRYILFGATDAELEREKASSLDRIKQLWLDRDKTHSAARAGSLLSSMLSGDAFPSLDERYRLHQEIIPTITREELLESIKGRFTRRGTLLFVTAPEQSPDIPAENELLETWQKWQSPVPIEPYVEEDLSRPLFSEPDGTKKIGSVIKTKSLGDKGVIQWTLSNGATVVLFPTTFKENEIHFGAFSGGGTSLVSDAEFPSAAFAPDYVEMSGINGFSPTALKKKLAGKSVSVQAWAEESYEGLSGYSSVEDLETLFQLVHLQFMAPDFSEKGWAALYAQLETVAKNRSSVPAQVFADLKTRLMWGDSIRQSNLTSDFVSRMDRTIAEQIYRQRFAGADDFTFVFTGSFDKTILKEYCERYIATLPATGKKEKAKAVKPAFPKKIVKERISMGLEEKSSVFLGFGGKVGKKEIDYDLFDLFTLLMDIRLREVVREELSGTYGVQVSGMITSYPLPRYLIGIEFGCEPGREEQLVQAILEQLDWLKGDPIPESYLLKLRETYRRSQESGLQNNRFWHYRITQELMRGRDLSTIGNTDEVLSRLSGEQLRDMARRFFKNDQRVEAYLVPAGK
ncbi:MAG: insulinase family protein [Spirochaetales bacterium]|nr:insulinase family protein [Spirochaetales bacterium]